jgi:hypothetical protein
MMRPGHDRSISFGLSAASFNAKAQGKHCLIFAPWRLCVKPGRHSINENSIAAEVVVSSLWLERIGARRRRHINKRARGRRRLGRI